MTRLLWTLWYVMQTITCFAIIANAVHHWNG